MNALVTSSKSLVKSLIRFGYMLRFKRQHANGEHNGKLLILMYHRVLPENDARRQTEEPGMYVSPETFDMHLCELKNVSEIIRIEDWLDLAQKGLLEDKLYCAITFDDGWADNYEFALPLLAKHGVPATVFLATSYIDTDTVFWPERLAALLKHSGETTPSSSLRSFFQELDTTLNEGKLRKQDKDYIASLINQTKRFEDDVIKEKLEQIEKHTEFKSPQIEMLTWKQVIELQKAGISIGGHTRTHLRLDQKASKDRIKEEVLGCAEEIQQHLGSLPTLFCYPNGDCSHDAINTVSENYIAAVTTESGINSPSNYKACELKRVAVHDESSNTKLKFFACLGRGTLR